MRRIYTTAAIFTALILIGILSCSENDEGLPTPDPEPIDYIPNADGATWVYDVVVVGGAYQNYTKVETINGTTDLNGVTCQILETTYPDWEVQDYYERTFFVDDESGTFAHWGVEHEEEGEVFYTNDYGQGYPVIKYPFVIGEEWDIYSVTGANPSEVPMFAFYYAYTSDDVDGDTIPDTMDLTVSAEVVGLTDYSVPAGTFEDCYHIKYSMRAVYYMSYWGELHGMGTREIWYKPGIGLIRSHLYWFYISAYDQEIMELVSYEIPD